MDDRRLARPRTLSAMGAASDPAARAHARYPLLLGDIGGTHARLAWVADAAATPSHVQTLSVADHAGPAAALQAYLQGLAGRAEPGPAGGGGAASCTPAAGFRAPNTSSGASERTLKPARAVLAVATPVFGDEVRFTNSGWRFSVEALRQALGLDALRVLNDFEALARALPGLQPGQWRTLGGPPPLPPGSAARGSVLAVLGPGTGLGVAAVVRSARGWQALPAEGGHATLAAADALQAEVIAFLRREHEHVSAERVLSGPALPQLRRALAAVLGQDEPAPMSPAELVAAAQQRGDALCARTLDLFIAFLGGFAGDLALTLGARGGVFIGGGVVPRFAERVVAAGFRAHFEAKGRMAAYLAAIPTLLITDTLAALEGARQAAEDEGTDP